MDYQSIALTIYPGRPKPEVTIVLSLMLPSRGCGVTAEHSGQATKHAFGLPLLDTFNPPG